MKKCIKLLLVLTGLVMITACSPPESSSEPIINAKKPIDKAKNVEKIILDQNKTIDRKIDSSISSD